MRAPLILWLVFCSAFAGAAELRVLTFNVCANDLDDERRLPALVDWLAEVDTDLIALQEVRPTLHRRLRDAPTWTEWHWSSDTVPIERSSGLLLLSRLPLHDLRHGGLAGGRSRRTLSAEVSLGALPLTVSTIHLASPLEATALRVAEWRDLVARTAQRSHHLVLGDANFGDSDRTETAAVAASGYRDAWRRLHPDRPGWTWDLHTNPWAPQQSFPGEPSRRLDRIFLRSPGLRVSRIAIVADQALPGSDGLFLSDHFGLEATLAWAGP